MATYYISVARGSDANTSVQAQNPATPWKTLARAIGAATPTVTGVAAAGDTIVVEPGVYRQASGGAGILKFTNGGTSGSPITVVGDVDGSLFRAGGYATPATGEVQVTPYAADNVQCAAQQTFKLNGNDWITLRKLTIIGGRLAAAGCVEANVAVSQNITIQDCALIAPTGTAIGILALVNSSLNWTVDRCWIAGYDGVVTISAPYSAAAEYNLNVDFTNCSIVTINTYGIVLQTTGTANTFLAYGVTVQGCSFFAEEAIWSYQANTTAVTNVPMTVKNSAFIMVLTAFHAGAAAGGNYIVEDYNVIWSPSATSYIGSVSAGAHSIGGSSTLMQYAPLFHFGQENIWGGRVRPFMMPTAGSPLLNFGDGTTPAYDIAGRNRPEGS
jgi:hypothetical protein